MSEDRRTRILTRLEQLLDDLAEPVDTTASSTFTSLSDGPASKMHFDSRQSLYLVKPHAWDVTLTLSLRLHDPARRFQTLLWLRTCCPRSATNPAGLCQLRTTSGI
jgi:hypothetical protein